MEGHLANISQNCDQRRQEPGIQGRMRMSSHVNQFTQERIANMAGMQRIDLRVFSAVQVVDVVALKGLVQKWKPEAQYE